MRDVIVVLLVAGLAIIGVPSLGGIASLQAQQGATVTSQGFAPNSVVSLVDANSNVIATATADAAGNVTFSNVAAGNFSVVGTNAAGSAVATTAAVTAAAVAAGAAVAAAGVATAAVAVGAAAGAVAAATAATAGALGAVGGVIGATAIAAGVAAGTAGIVAAAVPNDRDVCRLSDNTTIQIPDADPLPPGHIEGACPVSPE